MKCAFHVNICAWLNVNVQKTYRIFLSQEEKLVPPAASVGAAAETKNEAVWTKQYLHSAG